MPRRHPVCCGLASQAAATANPEELVRQLERIDDELPLALLMSRLFAQAGSQLLELPVGALAAVEQVAAPVNLSAGWLSVQREELAAICRYAAEAAWAREEGNVETADACVEYVNSLARDLLRELDVNR